MVNKEENNPAALILMSDLVENILRYSDNPGACAEYVTSQIRELIGVRIVVLTEHISDKTGTSHKLIGICPPRKESDWDHPEFKEFLSLASLYKTPALIDPEPDYVNRFLPVLGSGKSFVVPLLTGSEKVGMIILIGLMDPAAVKDILATLSRISGLIALILRNALLYQDMESLVEKRTQELREQEKFFRAIFEQAGVGVAQLDAETGRFVQVNNKFADILGYSPNELKEVNYQTITHTIDLPKDRENMALLKSGSVNEITRETRYYHKTGSLKWVNLTLSSLGKKDSPNDYYVAIVQDISEGKNAEEALQDREEFLSSIIENIPNMIFIKEAKDLKFVRFNKAGEKLLGLGRDELIGKSDFDFFSPEQARFFVENDRKVLKAGKMIDTPEEPINTKNGERILHTKKIPILDKNGKPAYLLGISEDITERRQTEEALRESEEKYRTLIHLIQAAVVVHGPDTSILTCNSKALELLGLTEDQLLGKTAVDPEWHFFREDNTIMPVEEYPVNLVFATRNELRNYIIGVHRPVSNDEIWVLVNADPVWSKKNELTQVIVTFVDITEPKQMEEELKEKQRLVLEAQRISHVGNWWHDLITGEIYWSEEFFRIIGREPQKVTPEIISVIHPEDLTILLKAMEESSSGKEEHEHIFRIIRPNGEVRWIHNRWVRINDKNGKEIKRVGTHQDITERKQAEAEIHKLNQELEQRVLNRTAQLEAANKELEAFAYSVSHDLRAPLRSIDGFSLVLLEEYHKQIDKQGQNYLQRVRSAAQRMSQLIDDMLKLSKVSRSDIKIQQINLSNIANDIIHELRYSDPERNVKFQIQDNIIVNADGRLLRIVLENLLGNAWKFTAKHPTTFIEFGMFQQDEKVSYFVRDDGAGFDIKYAQKLFGTFQRLHDSREFPGTGIGLATVQRIIHRHGGTVWAEAEIEKGATFYFTIP